VPLRATCIQIIGNIQSSQFNAYSDVQHTTDAAVSLLARVSAKTTVFVGGEQKTNIATAGDEKQCS